MTNSLLSNIFNKTATPSYMFNIDIFNERVALVKKEFGIKTRICFSIKANPFLLKWLPKSFDKIEVCSPGELTICEKTNIDMSKIIFSGVNKTQKDVERAMDDEVGVFTAESLLHIKLINASALKRNKTVPLLLRLTSGSQFGMDESDIINIVKNRSTYSGVDIVGIHFFTGTQKRKVSAIEKELDYVEGFINKIEKEHNFKFQCLEYGTGLAVDYFCDNADTAEAERLKAIAPKIRELSERIDLTVEMGRFFAAPCGYYFTKVIDTKNNSGINYAILDGGLNQLKYDGQIQGMQIPEIIHIKNSDSCKNQNVEKWTLCGSLCTTADVLAKNVEFSSLAVGDILVFKRTGAYSAMEGMAVFLSREMPVISVYSQEKGLEIIRKMIHTDIFNTP